MSGWHQRAYLWLVLRAARMQCWVGMHPIDRYRWIKNARGNGQPGDWTRFCGQCGRPC